MLLRFVAVYVAFLLLYQFYLNSVEHKGLDPFSHSIAVTVQKLQDFLGYPTLLYEDRKNVTTWFYTHEQYTSRMVEGCNAVSVMILFVAFVLAFYKGAKTWLFIAAGLVLLHFMNIFRIALINIVARDLPQYAEMTHDFVFPAIIYGTVVVLWLVWMKKFALVKK